MPSHPCVDVPQVIKYESVIHEFDPYFNYRVTQVAFRWRYRVFSLMELAQGAMLLFSRTSFGVRTKEFWENFGCRIVDRNTASV